MDRNTLYWSEDLMMRFIKYAILNKEESEILRLYILGYTINEIADEIGLSPSTVARRLKVMRLKYDNLINNGYDFPSRKNLQF